MTAGRGFRKAAADTLIRVCRRLFANTAIERLPVTSRALERVFTAGYGSGELDVEFRGMTFRVPASTGLGLVPALASGSYERLELDLFEALMPSAGSVVDVGGNVGVYACLAARGMQNGKVITVEPVPENLRYLQTNLEGNDCGSSVAVAQCAASDAPGTSTIYLADAIVNHSLSAEHASSSRSIQVDTTTIDLLVGGREVDVIKIDAEGWDWHVLRGAESTVRRCAPTLFIEFSPQNLRQAGTDPAVMVAWLCDRFEHFVLIDEPRGRAEVLDRSGIEALVDNAPQRNLVAVSRPDHWNVVTLALGRKSDRR